jgi:hypothetical protein
MARPLFAWRRSGLFFALFLWAARLCLQADTVTLAWDPNSESDLAGYRLYYGEASGEYSQSVDVGNTNTITVSTLNEATTYFFVVTAYDTTGLESDPSNEVSYSVPAANQPPVVSAGPDQTISLPASATLSGTATDDGWPNPPGKLTTTWNQVSGPGTVTFGNAGALSTSASFSTAGTYALKLTANDGSLSASSQITLTVNPANQPPVVSAGPDQTITLPASATLSGTATDDGWPNPPGKLTTTWSQVSGPGTVTFGNASALSTSASFSIAGTYVLKLTANDGSLSASSQMSVTVNPANQPPVAENGESYLQRTQPLRMTTQVADVYSPLALTLKGTDPDGDRLNFQIVATPQHGTLTGTAPSLIYTADADFPGSDRFTFRVSDGLAWSSEADYAILDPAKVLPAPSLSATIMQTDAAQPVYQLHVDAVANAVARLEATTNWADWTTLTVSQKGGSLDFTDAAVNDSPHRFYRAVLEY